MASWNVYLQLQNSTQLQLAATDHIWLNGTAFGLNVVAGSYQDSTHISDLNDVQRDTASPGHNTKYLTSSTVSLNGAASAAVSSVTTSQAPFLFQFTNGSTVATSSAKFFAYDGVNTSTAMANVTFQAAEQGNSSWTAANTLANALTLADHATNTTHNFYILVSASPTGPGAITGSVQIQLTYA